MDGIVEYFTNFHINNDELMEVDVVVDPPHIVDVPHDILDHDENEEDDNYVHNVASILALSKHFEPEYIRTIESVLKNGNVMIEDFLPLHAKEYLNKDYGNDHLLAATKFDVYSHVMYIEEVVSRDLCCNQGAHSFLDPSIDPSY